MSVEFTACTYQYRRGPVVLDGLSFAFPPGRTVLLKGMSRREAWDGALEALGRVGLAKKAGQQAASLSGGQLRGSVSPRRWCTPVGSC